MNNSIKQGKNFSLYRKLRKIALINIIIAAVWTLLFVLPIDFSQSLLRILVGGGPGIWLLIGYILFIVVGCLGFIGLSMFILNLDEAVIKSRSTFLIVGIIMFYVGVIGSTLGLGLAGTLGGYSTTILHAPITNTEAILQPFEKPIQTFLIITVIGVLILVYIFLAAESHEDK
jgi:hypothetical protein